MDVTFAKVSGRRYCMTVVREHGRPQLAPRQGPGSGRSSTPLVP
ncbi:hypothetical protein [Streptomyces sp. NPDC059466]